MKGKVNATKTLQRRWSNNRRVCNYHPSCGWFCRTALDNSAVQRSKADVDGHGSLSVERSNQRIVTDRGSVTAEFALVLPAVLLILLMALSALTAQAQRMNLVELSAVGARALARGEDEITLKQLLDQTKGVEYEIVHKNMFICLKLTVDWRLFWLGSFPIAEQQCSRKSGL